MGIMGGIRARPGYGEPCTLLVALKSAKKSSSIVSLKVGLPHFFTSKPGRIKKGNEIFWKKKEYLPTFIVEIKK